MLKTVRRTRSLTNICWPLQEILCQINIKRSVPVRKEALAKIEDKNCLSECLLCDQAISKRRSVARKDGSRPCQFSDKTGEEGTDGRVQHEGPRETEYLSGRFVITFLYIFLFVSLSKAFRFCGYVNSSP